MRPFTYSFGSFNVLSRLAMLQADQIVFKRLLQKKLPQLYAHFEALNVPYDQIIVQWLLSLYIEFLPTEACIAHAQIERSSHNFFQHWPADGLAGFRFAFLRWIGCPTPCGARNL